MRYSDPTNISSSKRVSPPTSFSSFFMNMHQWTSLLPFTNYLLEVQFDISITFTTYLFGQSHPLNYAEEHGDFRVFVRTASIRESDTSVLEDLKALIGKPVKEFFILNLLQSQVPHTKEIEYNNHQDPTTLIENRNIKGLDFRSARQQRKLELEKMRMNFQRELELLKSSFGTGAG
ncbi:hypothetical protein Tco_1274250 [Tanacetum coccineum]